MSESAYDGVLVFDGDCPFCSAAASALRHVDGIGAVAHCDPESEAFLRAQFEDTPFALVFADAANETVYVGRYAASELCDRAGMPTLVTDMVGENYESIADAVRTVTGVERDPDPYHGTYPMSDAALAVFDEMAATATSGTEHLH
jgi:predicted DCC family thiol-disulfide oxidoreductase YuxK